MRCGRPRHRLSFATAWGFTRFDLAWVAALVLLVLCNLLLPLRSSRQPEIAASGTPRGEERLLARELGLSGMQLVALAPSSTRPTASSIRVHERQILEAM